MAKAADQRNKDQAMAAHLIRMGYPHGRRMTTPAPGSGGYPVMETGSAAYRRLMAKKRGDKK